MSNNIEQNRKLSAIKHTPLARPSRSRQQMNKIYKTGPESENEFGGQRPNNIDYSDIILDINRKVCTS